MKDLQFLQLFDAYGALLTNTQREICEQYYLYDLSLSEIAQEKSISKQSVSDTLKKSRELCEFYEETLGCVKRQLQLLAAIEALKGAHPELSKEIGAIADMVGGNLVSHGEEEE